MDNKDLLMGIIWDLLTCTALTDSKYRFISCNKIITFQRLTWSVSFRFCGGLVLDVKRKLPFFASDFCDALHIQSLSTILFIYLGTVTNAITFGGLLGDATENMQVTLTLTRKTL